MKTSEQAYTSKAREALFALFREHGVAFVLDGDVAVLQDDPDEPEFRYRLDCQIVNVSEETNSMQLDVLFEDRERGIVESFAGWGEDLDAAFGSCVQNFCANTFHALLAAFFTDAYDDQVMIEKWTINGKERTVVIGNVGVRTDDEDQLDLLTMDWFDVLQQEIEAMPLDDELHWARLFHAQQEHEQLTTEVLLDNQANEELRAKLSAFAWPSLSCFYSQRLFLIIMDA